MIQKKSERAQAIIILAIAMVVILAFAALAIDAGRLYTERRRLQSAADAAAMAAAAKAADGASLKVVKTSALKMAWANGVLDNDARVNSDHPVDVIVNAPPLSGEYAGNADYYEVIIRTTQPTTFAGIIQLDVLKTEARAVSHVHFDNTVVTVTNENAVQSLSTTNQSLIISGTSLTIKGGNIYSNSTVKKSSGTTINLDSGSPFSHGAWSNSAKIKKGGTAVSPTVDKPAITPESLPEVKCPTNHFKNNIYKPPSTKTLNPGYYDHEVWLSGSATYTLNPGVYCFYNGLVVTDSAKLTGNDVFLIVLNGELRLNSTGMINLSRANGNPDSLGNDYGKMLAYVTEGDSVLPNTYSFAPAIPGAGSGLTAAMHGAPLAGAACSAAEPTFLDPIFGRLLGRILEKKLGCPTQTKITTITGGGGSSFTGNIYNPDHNCIVSGSTPVVINGSLVCESLTISATTVTINHTETKTVRPYVELSE